jgi:hypothetical protein
LNSSSLSGPKSLLLYVTDLIFETRICATAQALGLHPVTVRNVADLQRSLQTQPTRVLIVDLNADGDPLGAVRMANAETPDHLLFLSCPS